MNLRSKCRKLLGLAILLLCAQNTHSAGISHTSVGPTSKEEGELLWKDAETLYSNGEYVKARRPLERILARYPGHTHYIEAKLLLGRTYLRSDQPLKASKILKEIIQWNSKTLISYETRADLAVAQLEMLRAAEALLLCQEILNSPLDPSAMTPHRARSYLIKAMSHAELKQPQLAAEAIALAKKEFELHTVELADWKLERDLTLLDYQLYTCSLLPSNESLTEAQLREQMQRRKLCLMDAIPLGNLLFESKEPAYVHEASRSWVKALIHSRKVVLSPTHPPKTEKRTPQQLQTYLSELRDLHWQDHVQLIEALRTHSLKVCSVEKICVDFEKHLKDLTARTGVKNGKHSH